jgi:hypothetical protein
MYHERAFSARSLRQELWATALPSFRLTLVLSPNIGLGATVPMRPLAIVLLALSGGGSWLALVMPLTSGSALPGVPASLTGISVLLTLVILVTSRSGTCNAPCSTKDGDPCDNNVDRKPFFDHRCWIHKHSIWRLDEQYDDEIPTWYQEWWVRLQLESLVRPTLLIGTIVSVPGLIDIARLGIARA